MNNSLQNWRSDPSLSAAILRVSFEGKLEGKLVVAAQKSPLLHTKTRKRHATLTTNTIL